jgi:hypothetical protein
LSNGRFFLGPSHTRIIVPLLLLAILALPQAASAAPQAGVKAGDWASYDVSLNITGNKTLVQSFVAQYNAYANTSYVRENITAVYGTNVSLTQGIRHTNGTVVSNLSTVNVALPWDTSNPPIIIMQNYPDILGGITNGTFFGVPRIVNNLYESSSLGNASRYSWDENTGLLLSELLQFTVDANQSNTGSFTYSRAMSSTSLWHYIPPKTPPSTTPPTSPFGLQFAELYALAGVIGSVAIGAIAYATRRSPKSKGRPRTGARDSGRDIRDLKQKKPANN